MAGIKVDVNADTTGFQRGLDRLSAQADKFKQTVGRKFGLVDVGKGLLQGLGIGSVQQVAQLVTGFYERAAQSAKALEESTGRMLDMTLRAISLRNSPGQNADNLRGQAAGMNTEIGIQQGTLRDLKSNPLNWVTDAGRAAITDAEKALADMQEKQARLLYQADEIDLAEKRKLQTLRDQRMALEDNIDVAKGQMTELQAANRELQRMEWLRNRMEGGLEKGKGASDLEQVNINILRQRSVVEGLKMQERQSLFDYYNAPKPPSQLVADSLAKVGGGGRVGMSNSPQLAESKKQTNYLRQIANALSDQTAGRLK